MTPPDAATFEQVLTVGPADIDAQEHVNNVVFLQWVQDVAVAHWNVLATPAQHAEYGWVARRHEIDYLHPGVLGDELLVWTRVGEASKLTFERLTEIRRARDGRVLARARTLWCPIDRETGRLRRVPDEMRALVAVPTPPAGGGAEPST